MEGDNHCLFMLCYESHYHSKQICLAPSLWILEYIMVSSIRLLLCFLLVIVQYEGEIKFWALDINVVPRVSLLPIPWSKRGPRRRETLQTRLPGNQKEMKLAYVGPTALAGNVTNGMQPCYLIHATFMSICKEVKGLGNAKHPPTPAPPPATNCFHHIPVTFSSSVNSSGMVISSPMSMTYT